MERSVINDFGSAVFSAKIAADELVAGLLATEAGAGPPHVGVIPSVPARIKRSFATAGGAHDGQRLWRGGRAQCPGPSRNAPAMMTAKTTVQIANLRQNARRRGFQKGTRGGVGVIRGAFVESLATRHDEREGSGDWAITAALRRNRGLTHCSHDMLNSRHTRLQTETIRHSLGGMRQ